MSGFEALLLGSAASGTAAATTGLFGAGGAFGLGTTLSTIGTGLAVGSALSQGKAEASAANFNAQQSAIEAQSRETAQRAEGQRRLASIRAQIGKSGATSAGTPLAVLAESAANAEIDALNTRYTGMREQALYGASARNARSMGNARAGASLLSGFGRIL